MAEQNEEALARARAELAAGGGAERLERQHALGKWSARERLAGLFDEGTFEELFGFMRHRGTEFGLAEASLPGDGVVTGSGRVAGRLVYAYSQDFTVYGGSLGAAHAEKICRVLDLALKMGAPVVGFHDSGGARIQEGIDGLSGYGEIFRRNTWASGVIPQIAVIAGPCAGGAAYSPALMDFVLMVRGRAQMFVTGPAVIHTVTGEVVDAEHLGGADTHAGISGTTHLTFDDEPQMLLGVRTLLSYLPSNNLDAPPVQRARTPHALSPEAYQLVVPERPEKPYDVSRVLELLLDRGSFLQLQPGYARNLVVGFGRLRGRVVGVCANQPNHLAGCLDIDASDKLARFVTMADAFGIPLLTLVDTPGYLPGVAQEHGGIIRHGAKVLHAYATATVPKITLVLRKAYGGAYLAMCSRALAADRVFALPTAEIAVMGPQGAANIIFREQIAQAADPIQERQRHMDAYRERFMNPYRAAANGHVDDIITLAEARPRLVSGFAELAAKRELRPRKKHGNPPV